MRRDKLASWLALPRESSMVDLAILMGNDYIDRRALDLPDHVTKYFKEGTRSMAQTDNLLAYVIMSDPVVSTKDPQAQACLNFVRELYNLQDMSEYPMEPTVPSEDKTLIPAVDSCRGCNSRGFEKNNSHGKGDTCGRYPSKLEAHLTRWN
jgi:hypothetical protein